MQRPAVPQPVTPAAVQQPAIHPDVRVGHVHLRVAELDRALRFYTQLLGFKVFADVRPLGLPIAFLAAGDYHHHIALNASETAGASPAPPGHTGLHHVAFVYPSRLELAKAVARLYAHDYPVTSAYDHQATVSVFLKDPEGNGVELYYDRPRSAWFDAAGRPIVKNDAFDPKTLLRELENPA